MCLNSQFRVAAFQLHLRSFKEGGERTFVEMPHRYKRPAITVGYHVYASAISFPSTNFNHDPLLRQQPRSSTSVIPPAESSRLLPPDPFVCRSCRPSFTSLGSAAITTGWMKKCLVWKFCRTTLTHSANKTYFKKRLHPYSDLRCVTALLSEFLICLK